MPLVFANVATITSAGAFNNDLGTLLGYYQPGDGGGGNLYWDASSTETQDSGLYLKYPE